MLFLLYISCSLYHFSRFVLLYTIRLTVKLIYIHYLVYLYVLFFCTLPSYCVTILSLFCGPIRLNVPSVIGFICYTMYSPYIYYYITLFPTPTTLYLLHIFLFRIRPLFYAYALPSIYISGLHIYILHILYLIVNRVFFCSYRRIFRWILFRIVVLATSTPSPYRTPWYFS
jgi:hypothetical protein